MISGEQPIDTFHAVRALPVPLHRGHEVPQISVVFPLFPLCPRRRLDMLDILAADDARRRPDIGVLGAAGKEPAVDDRSTQGLDAGDPNLSTYVLQLFSVFDNRSTEADHLPCSFARSFARSLVRRRGSAMCGLGGSIACARGMQYVFCMCGTH